MVANRGVVASLTLLVVVSNGDALGVALGGEHRALEVEGDAREAMLGEALKHEAAVEGAQVLDAGRIVRALKSHPGPFPESPALRIRTRTQTMSYRIGYRGDSLRTDQATSGE